MVLISVVIPLYNKVSCIGRAIDSVLAQTVKDFEIIVVDDGSTDGSGEVVRKYVDPRLRLIQQRNYGVSAARNVGISESNGELIAFLDADDRWKPRFLDEILALKGNFPQAGAFATSKEWITQDNLFSKRKIEVLPPGEKNGLIANYFKVAMQLPLSSSSIVVPKKILLEIGGFPLFEDLSEDIDTWLRIAFRYPIAWSEEPLAIIHKDADNRALNTKSFSEEPIISRTIRNAIRAGIIPSSNIDYLKEYAASFQVAAARSCLKAGKRSDCLKLLDYSKGTQDFSKMWWLLRIFVSIPFNIGAVIWKTLDKGNGFWIKPVIKKLLR